MSAKTVFNTAAKAAAQAWNIATQGMALTVMGGASAMLGGECAILGLTLADRAGGDGAIQIASYVGGGIVATALTKAIARVSLDEPNRIVENIAMGSSLVGVAGLPIALTLASGPPVA